MSTQRTSEMERTRPMLRLKDVDPDDFAEKLVARVDAAQRQRGNKTRARTLVTLRGVARCLAQLAKTRTWPMKETTCDLAFTAVGVILRGPVEKEDPSGRNVPVDVRAFSRFYDKAPMTGACDDVVDLVMSCAALVIAIERGDNPPTMAACDLTSKTVDEIEALLEQGRTDLVHEWSVIPLGAMA